MITNEIDFTKLNNGLIPAIIQDAVTQKVLMLGYMNKESLQITLDTNKVTFFSRSRQRLWTKGEESGNFLNLVSVKNDCDEDTLLITVNPSGPTCHKGTGTCWEEDNETSFGFLSMLEGIIGDRKKELNNKNSYVSTLFKEGINKIAQKVGEEAIELVIESKDTHDELFLNEAADLLFHYLILLQQKGFLLRDVAKILESRHKTS